jgi:hypothetical protein
MALACAYDILLFSDSFTGMHNTMKYDLFKIGNDSNIEFESGQKNR